MLSLDYFKSCYYKNFLKNMYLNANTRQVKRKFKNNPLSINQPILY